MNGKVIILEENEQFEQGFLTPTEVPQNIFSESEPGPRLVIDRAAYTVYHDSHRISFPKKEFELLLLLASNPKKVFKREDILRHVWGKQYKPKDSRSLDVHIRMLRKKLGEAFISTVRGVGYKLDK